MTPRRAMEVFLETPGEVFVHTFPQLGVSGVNERFFSKLPAEEGTGLPASILTLKFSPAYRSTLTVDAEGIRQVLSFEQTDSPVFVPWAAVFAMHRGEVHIAWRVELPVTPAVQPKRGLSLVKN